jgi:hypothetical protein
MIYIAIGLIVIALLMALVLLYFAYKVFTKKGAFIEFSFRLRRINLKYDNLKDYLSVDSCGNVGSWSYYGGTTHVDNKKVKGVQINRQTDYLFLWFVLSVKSKNHFYVQHENGEQTTELL